MANFKVTIELAALDNASAVVSKTLNKITGNLTKSRIDWNKIGDAAFSASKKAAIAGGLIAAPLAYMAKQAVGFEESMAGVSKVAGQGYERGTEGLANLSTQAKGAAVALGIGADASGELMASLASGGVAVKDLAKIEIGAGRIGVAFDLAASVAGDKFVKMRNALGATNDAALAAADAINYISDNDASTAAQILDYMANGGASVARSLNIAAPAAATFGSALISIGKSGEEAGTIMTRFQKALYLKSNGDMLATYTRAGRGAAGLMAVLKKGADIKNPDEQLKYFLRMGEYGTSISQLSKSYGKLQENMALVNTLDPKTGRKRYEGSVNREFENRNSTTAGQFNRLKSQAGVLAVELGTTLLPPIADILRVVAPLVAELGKWVKANPELTTRIMKYAVAASATSFAVSGLSAAFGGLFKAAGFVQKLNLVSNFTKSKDAITAFMPRAAQFATWAGETADVGLLKLGRRFPMLSNGIWQLGQRIAGMGSRIGTIFSVVRGAFMAFGATVATISWPVVLAVAAIAAAAYLIYRNWDKLKPVFINTWRTIKNVSLGIWDTVVFYFGKAADYIGKVFAPVKSVFTWIKKELASIKMPEWLKTVGGWFGKAGSWISGAVAGAANSSAGFAERAAARRGIQRNIEGAVRPVAIDARAAARNAALAGGSVAPAGTVPGSVPVRIPIPANAPTAGPTTVQVTQHITVPAGAAGGDLNQFKKMLRDSGEEIGRIVFDVNRKKSRAGY